jgi:phosphoglycolate phosphatase
MRACIFDLDHTLVHSSLDLKAMALDMRALIERASCPLPRRPERYRVGELVAHCQREAPELLSRVWAVALEHEERALADATVEPDALAAVVGARTLGFVTALWTNNARSCTAHVLERFALASHLDVVVTRDEMAALKPDPAGFGVIRARFPALEAAVVVGDSWVDGVAASAAGIPFIAYRADSDELARRAVIPVARITRLSELLPLLASHSSASACRMPSPDSGRTTAGVPSERPI